MKGKVTLNRDIIFYWCRKESQLCYIFIQYRLTNCLMTRVLVISVMITPIIQRVAGIPHFPQPGLYLPSSPITAFQGPNYLLNIKPHFNVSVILLNTSGALCDRSPLIQDTSPLWASGMCYSLVDLPLLSLCVYFLLLS